MSNNKAGISKGFHHVAMFAKDFDKTVQFYTDGLGFKKYLSWGEGDGRAAMLDVGDGNYIEIFCGGSGDKPEGSWVHVAFRTENCDEAITAAKEAGAIVTMEPKDIDISSNADNSATSVRISFCKGLDGEIIEFFQYR